MFVIGKKVTRVAILGNYLLKTNPLNIGKHNVPSFQTRKLKLFFPFCSTNAPSAPIEDIDRDIQYEDEKEKIKCEEYTINYDNITEGNKELEHKLKVLMLEVEVLRQQGALVPVYSYIKSENWQHLLNLTTRSARRKYLEFLFKLSKKKENIKFKKMERSKHYEEFRLKSPVEGQKVISVKEHALRYELKYNSPFLRFYDTTINNFYNKKLIEAIQFGQKLVIDCGYAQNMTPRENMYCAKQLMLLFSENRIHSDPFDIHYANYNRESMVGKFLSKFIPTVYDNDFPISIHKESYLNVFPREKLIYLTPHCKEEMESFDHDAVYIIGGIVDKMNNEPLSLAKAKREGLKMLKFPLDKYLLWGAGSGKSLTINQCVAILLDIKATGNWQYALRHVPKRKLADLSSQTKKFKLPSVKKHWKPS